MTLIKEGIITSVLLIFIGVGGYIAGMQSEKASFTALIPAVIGILIPFGRLILVIVKGDFAINLPILSVIATIVICGIFLVLCVRSFIQIRKNRVSS